MKNNVIGMDIAKNVFQLAACPVTTAWGSGVLHFRNSEFLKNTGNIQAARPLMKAVSLLHKNLPTSTYSKYRVFAMSP